MALINCSECGNKVSDKAKACPYCGCPIEKLMVCPECGKSINEGNNFCDQCGCELNLANGDDNQISNNQNNAITQVGNSDEKTNNTLRWLLLAFAALVVLGGSVLFAWHRGIFNNLAGNNDTTSVDSVALDTLPDMAAPVIELNEDGMYTVDNCPTTYEGLEIIIEKDFNGLITRLDVMKDGKLNCSFVTAKDNNPSSNQIHFLDANFDGYVDFFLGTVYDRELSLLFLWDPTQQKFQIAMNGTLFNGIYYFHPAGKKVYCINTGGWASTYFTCSSWIGEKLFLDEQFCVEYLKINYSEDHPNRYVIRNALEKIILSTDDYSKIPARWKKWIRVPTPDEEKQYAETDAQVIEAQSAYSPDENESDIKEIKSWIQGTWYYRTVSEFGPMEARVTISGDNIVVTYNGEEHYRGIYKIEDNNIKYNRHKGWSEGIMIDRTRKRLMANESEPMTRVQKVQKVEEDDKVEGLFD